MSDTSGATHKLLLATSLVLINSLFAGEIVTYDPTGSGGGSTPGTAPSYITINRVPFTKAIAPSDTSLSDNVVTILSTDTSNVNYAFGGYSGDENVENNIVNISSGAIGNNVYGGYSYSDLANLNTVNISGGTIGQNVYGGYSYSDLANLNTVNISGGTIGQNVYGGYSVSGSATKNTVTISGTPTFGIDTIIRGGDIDMNSAGATTGNTLNIKISNLEVKDIENFEFINFYLFDDAGKSSAILNLTNSLKINLSTSKLSIGLMDNGNTPDLKVGDQIILIGKSGDTYAKIPNTVADDSLYKFDITKVGNNIIATLKNEVLVYNPENAEFKGVIHKSNTTLKDASIGGDNFGKYIAPDSASYNDNVISIYSTNSDVYNVLGGYSDTEAAERNTVNIYGGTIGRNIYGSYTAYKDKVANRNTINIFGGTINHDIYGGFSSLASAMRNTVNISGGIINNNVYGGTGSGEMSRNTINISGGTISKFVFGGSSSSGSANSNTINISGGTIGMDIYGGYGGNGPKISANLNTINISGNPDFKDIIIYGGDSSDKSANVTTGNTLNIKTSNLEVKDIKNFENINFYTSQDTTAGETLLNLTSVADVDISSSNIAVGVKQGDTPTLKVGEEITLINRSNNTINLLTNNMMNNTSAITDMNSSYTFTLGGAPKDTTSTDISKLVAVFGVTTYNPGNVAAANGTIYYSNTAPVSNSIKPNGLNDNIVNIYSTSSNIASVLGGYSVTEAVEKNTVNIYNGTINDIYGGYSESGSVNSNTVNISGGTIDNNVHGGLIYSGSSSATNNTVNIYDGTINGNVSGGYSDSGSSDSNTVNIYDGTISNVSGGSSYSGLVTNNTVNISGGTISNFVYGGYSYSGSINSNTVNISGGIINNNVFGGNSSIGSANSNTVNISGGIINNNVFGGNSSIGSANSNTVNISGGTISGNIYGGNSNSGSSNLNTITISKNPTSGNPIFGANATIYGGNKGSTGNTLNIKTSNLEVKDIANFEFINFYLDKSIKANDTLLTLSDDTNTGPTDLSNSKIGVGVIRGDTSVLNSNDKIILIDKPNGSLTKPNDMSNHMQVMQGISNSYEFTLSTVNSGGDIKQIVASLTPPSTPVIIPPPPYVPPTPITPVEPKPPVEPEVPVIPAEPDPAEPDPAEPVIEPEVPVQPVTPYTINEKQKAVLEGGFVSSLMLNNSNQALESGLQDMSQALNASGANETSIGNTNVSSTRNKTGSHVDVKSISLLVGFAKKANDSFMYSAFFEAGFGNYDSYNNFSTGDIKGSGDSSYYGFGVLSKFDMINNYYFENSLRVGQIKSDFSSDDFGIATPISSSFDSKRYYIGAHIGLGKVINLNNSSNLDIYTKVFYTRVDSEDITMSTNDRFRLDAINSVSAKLGFLYNYELKENLSLYSGASFSKEFNAEAKGRNISYNYDLDSPSMKGNTRSLEAGIKLKPISNNDKLSLDLGIVGLVGKSEGVSGKFGFKWKL
ncbi:autotransporter outer membrane beta-barrel domain-containing protein [Campylobacter fetus]|nr:autotransporter outer membrane beta-barrel domain-containing protein [Campylobacter fetus]